MKKRTHAMPHAKLTEADVLKIRQLKGSPQKLVAAAFGIHITRVSQIMNDQAWRWLKNTARAVTLLIVVSATAHAEPSELLKMMNACNTSVGAFFSENM